MKTGFLFLCLLGFTIAITSEGYGQAFLSPKEAKEDLDFLVGELKAKHQGLYLHLSQDISHGKIDSLRATMVSSLSLVDFYKKVRALLALTHEGHTSAYLSAKAQKALNSFPSFLPLQIQFLGKEAIIHQYFGEEKKGLQRGMKLLSINGVSIEELVKKFTPYLATDGFGGAGVYQDIADLFPFYYRVFEGPQNLYTLEVVPYGDSAIQVVQVKGIKASEGNGKQAQLLDPVFEAPLLDFDLIQDSIAYLAVNSFAIKPKKFGRWLHSRFQEIARLSVQHLILDIQDNTGGEEGNENLLMSYVSSTPFQKYDFVSMTQSVYQQYGRSKILSKDQWALDQDQARAFRGKFTLQSDYFSETQHTLPSPEYVFKGKLYLLTGKATFSGGAEFATMVKMTQRGVLIGEETGGTYEGNVSGYSEVIILPHSQMEVSLPLVHFRMKVSPEIPSRGVMPDYEVTQSWQDYMNGRNTKKEYVLEKLLKE